MNNLASGYNYSNSANMGGCSYAQLGSYNNGGCCAGIRPPVPMTAVSGYYVVPAYSSPGYDTLNKGGACGCGSGGGYFNIVQAYGQNAGNCATKYMGALCS